MTGNFLVKFPKKSKGGGYMSTNFCIYENVRYAPDVTFGEFCVVGRMPKPVKSIKKDLVLDEDMVTIGEGSVLCPHVVVYAGVKIGERVLIGDHSSVFCRVSIGNDVLISRNVTINSDVTIGDHSRIMDNSHVTGRCVIGTNVFISVGVSMANDSFFGMQGYNEKCRGPLIEDDSCIGAGAVLLPNVRIGKGSVVAAGSVVKKNVPNGMIVSGNPARIVGPVEILFNV